MRIVYLVLSLVGLVGTWWFNIASMSAGENYLAGWFANAASSSAAVDIIVVAIAACVFMVVEGRRLGWPTWSLVLLVVGSFAIAAAFVFPLFLFLRDRAVHREEVPA
ncbi:DUF2834 domain-containing protein [Actinomycetospora sp. OC33-EN08]|uniref:DUF2834 domain-containing protein n=1 Tax=Actinomycetospora aurantiaca TaxID=3129233 RepID=A0ABU8MWR4_9PSEU